MMAWFGNIDDRITANNGANSTRTFQLRSQEGSTRVVFWTSPSQGEGLHTFLEPSMQYKVGPYQLNGVAGFDRYNESRDASFGVQLVGRATGTYWKLMNDLMVWSPKGFLTGAPGEPGTVGLGYSFEKSWADCGNTGCDQANAGTVRRTTLTVNEGGIRYWFSPSISLWLVVKNYDVSNTPLATQVATGCTNRRGQGAAGNSGKSCNFTDAVIRFYAVY
jgi:hypothetical protein